MPDPAPTDKMEAMKRRFWKKVRVGTPQECWEWTGSKNGSGYGQFMNGTCQKAHRVAWILTMGPIPKGACCLHRCDNPACVNPDHLWLGSMADNTHDMLAKRRDAGPTTLNREKKLCKRGHPLEAPNLYVCANGWRECLACKRIHRAIYSRKRTERRIKKALASERERALKWALGRIEKLQAEAEKLEFTNSWKDALERAHEAIESGPVGME